MKRGFAEAIATEVLVAGRRSGSTRRASTTRRAAAAASRISPTRPRSRRRRRRSRDALVRLGRIADPPLEPILPAESSSSTTATSSSTRSRPRRAAPRSGFHRAGRWDEVLEVDRCWLTTDLGNSIRDAVREWAQEEGLPAFDQEAQTGYLRHLVVREGRNTGQALVQLVTAPGDLRARPVRRRAAAVPRGALDPLGRERLAGRGDQPADEPALGRGGDRGGVLGLRFRVRPNAFMQTNTAMAERLYDLAIEFAGLPGSETVYDLYCGTGTIGLAMSSRGLTVWGLEANEESVACAIENAGLNGITNAAFFAGEVGARWRTSPSAPGSRTWRWSIPRARGSPGRRCAGWPGSRRRRSSMSPATRPRLREN